MDVLKIRDIILATKGTLLWGKEDLNITEVLTNSGKAENGSLFVPIVGERVDGHNYIQDAFSHGATACLSQKELPEVKGKTCILVENTLEALQALGAYYRQKFPVPVIGITGSVGKTTTKEMIAAALEVSCKVLKTEGNMNSQVGLPLMMLKLNKEHELAVIEMGMSEEGEMARLCDIAQPEAAVMTNIGVSHIAQLKTRENIRKEKMNIINSFQSGNILVLNGDDDLLGAVAREKVDSLDLSDITAEKLKDAKVITYGIQGRYDFTASDIRTVSEETTFLVTYPKEKKDLRQELLSVDFLNTENEDIETITEEVSLKVPGLHNVYNALAALAVAWNYGIPVKKAKQGLTNYRPIAMRGQITNIKGIKVIDDSYNASPDSMKSGIGVLKDLENVTRHIAVLADVKELGEISQQSHYEVGEYIAEVKLTCVVTIGIEARYIAQAIQDKKASIETYSFDNNDEAIKFLKEYLQSGDGVLVKGSRSMKTDEIVKSLLQ